MILINILIFTLTFLLIAITIFFKWSFTYWKRRGAPQVLEPQIPFGNIANLMKQKISIFDLAKSTYETLKARNYTHGGVYFFAKPVWVPVDLELIRNVMIRDFSHFVNHGFYVNEEVDPLTGNLFFLEDDKWKRTRAALTHTFTTGKIKMMFKLMVQCAENLEEIIRDAAVSRESIDVKDYVARFTMDNIASSAFGLEINTIKNPERSFRKYGKRAVEDTAYEALRTISSFILPRKLLTTFKFKLIKPDVENFFLESVKRTVRDRETNNVQRNDFLQLLIQLKNTGRVTQVGENKENLESCYKMTIEEVAAEAFIFYLAGFETTATTSTFAMLELSLNQNIQDKVRDEIKKVLLKHDGQLTYEACNEMQYLEQVIKETLRKYPPLSQMTRLCTKDYKVPGSDVKIERGTLVMIPIVGIHYDSDIYPKPYEFDPDRFGDSKKLIPNNAFLSFGEGPRTCVGMRLGMIQTKVALATILKNHRVTLNQKKTIFPVQFEPKYQVTTARGGIWLDIAKIV